MTEQLQGGDGGRGDIKRLPWSEAKDENVDTKHTCVEGGRDVYGFYKGTQGGDAGRQIRTSSLHAAQSAQCHTDEPPSRLTRGQQASQVVDGTHRKILLDLHLLLLPLPLYLVHHGYALLDIGALLKARRVHGGPLGVLHLQDGF